MKVLVVAHESEFVGGANRALFSILEYWTKHQLVEYEVLLPSAEGACIEALKNMGIQYHVMKFYRVFSESRNNLLDGLRHMKVVSKFIYNQQAAKKFANCVKDNKFQLVYSNTRMTTMGSCVAKELGIPHVIHIREFGNENTIWGPANIKWIYNHSAKIIAISNGLKEDLVRTVNGEKIFVSYDGVSYSHAVDISEKKKDTVDILLTGRITPAKAQDEAIRTLKLLRDRGYRNIVLHFAGSVAGNTQYEKQYLTDLQALIKEYDLDSCIVFHGEVSNIKSLREKMDIELMCALRETFGWVTVEGMRSGLLVIGGNTGATPEIIEHKKNGLIYEQGNPADLADKIAWAVTHPQETLEIRKYAYEHSYEKYTVEENASDILKIFNKVLSEEY